MSKPGWSNTAAATTTGISSPTFDERDVSSRVVVLHQGRIVLDGAVAEVVASELVRNIYAGAGHA